MKLFVLTIALITGLGFTQQPRTSEVESRVAERKKQLEELKEQHAKIVLTARNEVAANPDSAEAHFQLAEVLLKGTISGTTWDEIPAEYKKAIELKPDYAEAYLGLSLIQGLRSKTVSADLNLPKQYAEQLLEAINKRLEKK